MYKRILISTDGSSVSERGVEHGLSVSKDFKAVVTIITVTERFPPYSMGAGYDFSYSDPAVLEYTEAQRSAADAILSSAKKIADRLGVAVETLHVPNAHVADAIIESAAEHNCDLIVMASHGRRGLERVMLGSKTIEVLSKSKIPVLVVR